MKYWCRLGIWVALAAGFYILVNEVLENNAFYETWRWHIYKVLIGGGALIAATSKRAKVQSRPAPANGDVRFSSDDSDSDGASARIFSQRYCGFILTTFGVIVRVVIPSEDVELRVAARADAEQGVAEVQEAAPEAKVNTEPTGFPDLRLQGVFCSKTNPSALINRKTYFLGDLIDGAKVSSILPDSIILQKNGESKVYLLKR